MGEFGVWLFPRIFVDNEMKQTGRMVAWIPLPSWKPLKLLIMVLLVTCTISETHFVKDQVGYREELLERYMGISRNLQNTWNGISGNKHRQVSWGTGTRDSKVTWNLRPSCHKSLFLPLQLSKPAFPHTLAHNPLTPKIFSEHLFYARNCLVLEIQWLAKITSVLMKFSVW